MSYCANVWKEILPMVGADHYLQLIQNANINDEIRRKLYNIV